MYVENPRETKTIVGRSTSNAVGLHRNLRLLVALTNPSHTPSTLALLFPYILAQRPGKPVPSDGVGVVGDARECDLLGRIDMCPGGYMGETLL